jgi:hypothetical protein
MDSIASILFPLGDLQARIEPKANLSWQQTSDKLIISLAVV